MMGEEGGEEREQIKILRLWLITVRPHEPRATARPSLCSIRACHRAAPWTPRYARKLFSWQTFGVFYNALDPALCSYFSCNVLALALSYLSLTCPLSLSLTYFLSS